MSKKKPEVQLPADDNAANDVLLTYAKEKREVDQILTAMNADLLAKKQEWERKASNHLIALAKAELQLTQYAIAHRDRLTDGNKTKTIKMPAGELSWRQRPDSVRFPSGAKNGDVVALIEAAIDAKRAELRERNTKELREDLATLEGFIRTTRAPNKEAMLEDADLAEAIPGVKVGSTGEDFSIEPFAASIDTKAAA